MSTHIVADHFLREGKGVCDSVSMDLWEVMILMSHPGVASGLAVLLGRLVVLVGVCVVAHLIAMVVLVV